MNHRHFLSLGAGVQSSTLALMFARGPIGDHPPPEAALFADVGNEPEAVYAHLERLRAVLPFPVIRVAYRPHGRTLREEALAIRTAGEAAKRPGRRYTRHLVPYYTLSPVESQGPEPMLFDLGEAPEERRGRIPRRGCTVDFKIRPLTAAQRRLAGVPRGCREPMVTRYIGFSWDEIDRMAGPEEPWAVHAYPLIDLRMTRADCLAWIRQEGFPEPPRSACYFCPFHSNAEWQRLKTEAPADFARAVEFERLVNENQAALGHSAAFLHDKRIPLGEIDFAAETDQPGRTQGCSPYGCPNGGALPLFGVATG